MSRGAVVGHNCLSYFYEKLAVPFLPSPEMRTAGTAIFRKEIGIKKAPVAFVTPIYLYKIPVSAGKLSYKDPSTLEFPNARVIVHDAERG